MSHKVWLPGKYTHFHVKIENNIIFCVSGIEVLVYDLVTFIILGRGSE